MLPIDAVGDVRYNTWAFFPVFPGIVKAVMTVTGLGFTAAGIAVATVFGAGAMLALHRVLLVRFTGTQALWGALLFAVGPLSFLLQVAYAESTFLFFLFLALWFMQRKRYLAMIPFALVASFTHPGALALAAALAFQGLHRVWRRHPIPRREWITGIAAITVVVAAALFWPVLVSTITGDPSGYFDTELAWWRSYLGRVIFVPFTPFFLFYGDLWGVWGILLVVVVLAAVVFWLTRRSTTRVYGANLWSYAAGYIAYLVAVFLPTQSLMRQLLPLSPLLGHPALSRTPRRRVVTLASAIVLQAVAIFALWVVYPP
jgi:Gpi18-like mannosyltransferase